MVLLDKTKNRIPEKVKTVHLTAICGTGMGALAAMLKDGGYRVTGSDADVYPPMSDFLRNRGIEVMEGFCRENLSHKPDLVVIGNAVTPKNPEALAVGDLGLSYCSMPQAVNHFLAKGKKTVLVTGTHGKTTTSSLIAWILYAAGRDPSFLIGGILKNFDGNYRAGEGEVIVLEGDEYDTAFFDKVPKFVHYQPEIAVLTSVEFDHADIYRDLEDVKDAFSGMVEKISTGSKLYCYSGDENVGRVIQKAGCRVYTYGKKGTDDWRIGEIAANPLRMRFVAYRDSREYESFEIPMTGEHNLLNALAAIAVAVALGIEKKQIKEALSGFQGIRRRQEIRGVKNDIIVMDDFAHHPTAVRETISGVRDAWPERRLVAVFEPRTNTSMRAVFQQDYARVFDRADLVCIREASRLDKIPETERFSSRRLVSDIDSRGKTAFYFTHTDDLLEFLLSKSRPGDVVLIMSNGGFDNLHQRLLDAL